MSSAQEATPAAVADLERRILGVYDNLTIKQHRVARFMMDNVMVVALAPASEVAERSGVNAATVVRFCQLLGYTGYAQLRREITQSIPHFATAVAKMERPHPRDSSGSIVMEVLSQDALNVERTIELNGRERFAKAVELLGHARRVLCIGFGRSGVVAELLAEHLSLVGVPAQGAHRDVGQAAAAIAHCREEDVVVIVSLWRYHRSAVRLFRAAVEASIPTVVITDNSVSPFAKDASIVLIAATETPGLTHSLTGLVALCNALATDIAFTDSKRAVEGFRKVDEIYDDLETHQDATASRNWTLGTAPMPTSTTSARKSQTPMG
jgi:DNA-binding MurR/RpiR family transcriptional regulator